MSTNQHFQIIQEIINITPHANIFVEKPVCLFAEISSLRKVLLSFQGKITVNENYVSSVIKDIVQKIAWKNLKISPQKLVVEFTKNRGLDFSSGRFIDNELGVLGYEGSHMLALVSTILKEDTPRRILETQFSDFIWQDSSQYLDNQGSAYIRYQLSSGVEIELYTSMMGKVKYNYPLFFIDNIPYQDQDTKYRIVALHGNDCQNNTYCIVGFLEPINCFHRCYGAVYVLKNEKVEKIIGPISDDTMLLHFQKTLKYFQGHAENPYSVEQGIRVVEILHLLANSMHASNYLVAS